MSDLPAGWVDTTIGEVVVPKVEQRIPSAYEDFFYIDISSVDRVAKKIVNPQKLSGKDAPSRARQVVASGDVLVSMTRPNLNAVAMVSKALDGQIASTGFDVLRAKDIESRWLYYLVRTNDFVTAMSDLVQGALYPAVRPGDVRNFEIPLSPLNEQKRIAEKLDSVLARVDSCQTHLERVPQILKHFRQSVLAAATSGRLTEDWREENKSKKWKSTTIGDLCENSFYGPRFGKNEYTDSEKGIPTIRTTDMTVDGRIEITQNTPKILVPPEKLELYRARKGDLLVTRTGSIGVMAVFEDDYMAIPSAYLIRFRFYASILPRYAFYCLMSPYGKQQLGLSTTAITQPNINAEAIKKIEIQLPTLEEQAEIVRRVEKLFAYAERLEARYTSASEHVERLTPSLLAKAFRGELVGQNPSNESATILLERIRAIKESAQKIPVNRKPPEEKKERIKRIEGSMLKKSEIQNNHLSAILNEHGSMTAEALWAISQLDIDEFYDQLKDEEDKKYLREVRSSDPNEVRLLEAL